MQNQTNEMLMSSIEELSEAIHSMLTSRCQDLDSILVKMQAREACLSALIPKLKSDEKSKWIMVLSMIRDKEAMALLPYRQDLLDVEDNLIAIHQMDAYRGPGDGSGGLGT